MPVQKGRLWILGGFSTVKNKRWRDSFDNVHHSDILM
uniref:Uncharacterized protein n=1 Tax=Anguilla anguilla TaxID=7936 RepID=A0A0E9UZQ3_ANGAN